MRSVTEVHGLRYFFFPEEELLLLLLLLLRCDICKERLLLRWMSVKNAPSSKAGGALTIGAFDQSDVALVTADFGMG